jgi:hypothetical protein
MCHGAVPAHRLVPQRDTIFGWRPGVIDVDTFEGDGFAEPVTMGEAEDEDVPSTEVEPDRGDGAARWSRLAPPERNAHVATPAPATMTTASATMIGRHRRWRNAPAVWSRTSRTYFTPVSLRPRLDQGATTESNVTVDDAPVLCDVTARPRSTEPARFGNEADE